MTPGVSRHGVRNFALSLALIVSESAICRETMETKASDNGGRGREVGNPEAGGRGRQSVYTCAGCGAQNSVDSDWTWFTCWKCNLQKPLPLPGR